LDESEEFMSMELWQRLKDLEKKVQEHSDRLKALSTAAQGAAMTFSGLPQPAMQIDSTLSGAAVTTNTLPWPTPEEKRGPALCPKCGKVPGYFFHVKYCKGNADVA
jgi:hypothetical protein